MKQWQSLALSSDQQSILETFGVENSWSLTYNLYANLLLGTGLVQQSVSAHVVGTIPEFNLMSTGARCSYEFSWDPSEPRYVT